LGLGSAFAFGGKKSCSRRMATISTSAPLADVLLSDSTHVNHMLVKDGWCWWYRKYAPGDTVLEQLADR
jgi:hypothetical protein